MKGMNLIKGKQIIKSLFIPFIPVNFFPKAE